MALLLLHRVMHMRLKANQAPWSVERALEQLKRIQLHRVALDKRHLSGITKLTPEQRELFDQLEVPTPSEAAL